MLTWHLEVELHELPTSVNSLFASELGSDYTVTIPTEAVQSILMHLQSCRWSLHCVAKDSMAAYFQTDQALVRCQTVSASVAGKGTTAWQHSGKASLNVHTYRQARRHSLSALFQSGLPFPPDPFQANLPVPAGCSG